LLKHLTVMPENIAGGHTRLALILYFGYKISLVVASTFAIYLGYRLFILGVKVDADLKELARMEKGTRRY